MLTLRIQQMTINGTPYLCPECASEAFTLDGTGFINAFPVRGNCWQSHSWEEPLITLGDLKQINEVRTGRQRAEDDDTFEIVIGRALITGTLHPDVILDDLKRAARDVYWKRIIKPAVRRRKNKVKQALKRPIKTARAAVAGSASKATAATKAAALDAAWQARAGSYTPDPDYQPDPVTACVACHGTGGFNIDSRVHEVIKVPCSACSGTGQID